MGLRGGTRSLDFSSYWTPYRGVPSGLPLSRPLGFRVLGFRVLEF